MGFSKRRGARLAAGILTVAAGGGCAGLLSVEDLGYEVAADASVDETSDSTAPPDAAKDGTFTLPDGAVCSPENCLDGIDNDCNGKADCQDEACVAFACGAAVPGGWQPAAIAPDLDASCPNAFVKAGRFNEKPSGTVVCGCTCTADAGECTGRLVSSTATNCSGATDPPPNGQPVFLNADAGCVDNPFINVQPGGSFQVVSVAPAWNACLPQTNVKPGNLTFGASGTACIAPSAGAGCQPSQPSCIPAAGRPFVACISRTGDVPCPDGGTWERHVIGDRDLDGGSAIGSDASCAPCACTPESTCTNVQASLYGTNCADPNPTLLIQVTEACTGISSAVGASSHKFVGTTVPNCQPGTSTPTGAVTFAAPTTVCCPK
jgi:hypothetical protein